MDNPNTQETNSLHQKPSSSPSPLSSPSHEFSFTITLHPSPTSSPPTFKPTNKALDLAPADDIFFHGHLLPLHLLSHPRPSTDISVDDITIIPDGSHPINLSVNNQKNKPNSLSSLSKLTKWLEDKKKHFLKKFFSKEEKHKRDLQRRPYSFSGNSNRKEKWISRRGEFSAPASMRTSPTNSGLLLATPPGYSSSNESSMEELQNAILAAIAHCKNSSATKERQVKV